MEEDMKISSETLSSKIMEDNTLWVSDVKEAIKKLKEEIKSQSSWRVVNGKLPKQRIDDFNEGETIGRDSEKELALEIIDKIFGNTLTK